jgi:hypothetical protein
LQKGQVRSPRLHTHKQFHSLRLKTIKGEEERENRSEGIVKEVDKNEKKRKLDKNSRKKFRGKKKMKKIN